MFTKSSDHIFFNTFDRSRISPHFPMHLHFSMVALLPPFFSGVPPPWVLLLDDAVACDEGFFCPEQFDVTSAKTSDSRMTLKELGHRP